MGFGCRQLRRILIAFLAWGHSFHAVEGMPIELTQYMPSKHVSRATGQKRCISWDYKNSPSPGHPGVPFDEFINGISCVINWNAWYPPGLAGRASFRPMVREEAQLSGGDWQTIESSDQEIIHFFNEPDRDPHKIAPKRAAELWFEKMVPLRQNKGKKLVSPSCASTPEGTAWINEWMDLVAAEPPDFLGLHYYGDSGDSMIAYLEARHNSHPKQAVIVSEWASIAKEYSDVDGMTVQLVNWMDEQGWIHEYALFGAMPKVADNFVSKSAQLMSPDGKPTDLYRRYQLQVPMRHRGE